ncbi:MAG: iron-containing alcohol dehydrogenase, partial [Acidobacteriia bacterium]|nr:iron-containing alcohol dehydrogenase [Terriglobia bacterium]
TSARIVFGAGAARDLPKAAAAMGRRALLVTGASPERAAALLAGMDTVAFAVAEEPTLDLIRRGVAFAREEGCDLVVAVGGGSAIDAGKALAALTTNHGDPLDYLEVIGRGQPLSEPPLPFIAVPTTAGTGAEVTRNAVLGSPEHHVKASLRSASMLPRLAIVDPELTITLPRSVTASTGLDTLTQLIEPYVSVRANPMTDLFCVEGIRCVTRALARAWENGGDLEARTDMSWAALLGGMALANAGLGAVHGFAAPVGGMFPAPHGAVCAALLPHTMEVNVRALTARMPQSSALDRYSEVARLLTGRADASANDGVEWVGRLCRKLEIAPLRAYGVRREHYQDLVAKAARTSSMKGNPISLSPAELQEILERAG